MSARKCKGGRTRCDRSWIGREDERNPSRQRAAFECNAKPGPSVAGSNDERAQARRAQMCALSETGGSVPEFFSRLFS